MTTDSEIKTYRKIGTVNAVRLMLDMEPLKYKKWGGDQTAEARDWLVYSNGSTYTINALEFSKTYQHVSDGVYRKSSLTYARELMGCGKWPTLEGDSDYKEGDFLCASNPKMNDSYPVIRETFLATYVRAEKEIESDEDETIDPLIPLLDAVRGWVSNSGVDASKVIDAARPWVNHGYPGLGGVWKLRDNIHALNETLSIATDQRIKLAAELREATEKSNSTQEELDCITRMLDRAQDLGALEWGMEAENVGISVPSVGRVQELEKEIARLRENAGIDHVATVPAKTKIDPAQGWSVHRGSGWRCGHHELAIECGKAADWLGAGERWRCDDHVPRVATGVVRDAGWFETEKRITRLQGLVGTTDPDYVRICIYREFSRAHEEWRNSLEDLRDNTAAMNRMHGESFDDVREDRDLLIAALRRILNLPTDGPHNDFGDLIGAMQNEDHVACNRLEVKRQHKMAARRGVDFKAEES